uniref:Ig-like domain-containing protein n=1 Tax=Sinocyclocheilus rhinocerous TaxID=307959 RepID=A0A673IZR0_9TELE
VCQHWRDVLLGRVLVFSQEVDIISHTPEIFANGSSNVTLTCQHDNSNHNRLFWYKQTKGSEGLSLLVFSIGQNQIEIEAPFKTHKSKYAATRPEIKMSTLLINKLETEDSALYYCATSTQYHITTAHFGEGTKLTVLGKKHISYCLNGNTSCKQKVTLVCVAKNFYPDHVSITWTIGSKEIKDDVATDPYATQDEKTKLFSITSRLKVSKKEFKPQNTFRCTVRFYNETDVSINRHGKCLLFSFWMSICKR